MQNLKRTATASFRVDPDVKRNAEKIFAHLGLTLSDAINIFLRKSINENGIPFSVNDPYYRKARSQEELDAILEARRLAYEPTAKRYSSHKEIVTEVMSEIALGDSE